jgi:hypothetical protein
VNFWLSVQFFVLQQQNSRLWGRVLLVLVRLSIRSASYVPQLERLAHLAGRSLDWVRLLKHPVSCCLQAQREILRCPPPGGTAGPVAVSSLANSVQQTQIRCLRNPPAD